MPVSSKARKLNEAKMYIKKVNPMLVIRQNLCLLKVAIVTDKKKKFVPSGSFLLGRNILINVDHYIKLYHKVNHKCAVHKCFGGSE